MNAPIFLDIEPCGAHVNRRFGGMYHIDIQNRKCAEQQTNVLAEAIRCSGTSVRIRAALRCSASQKMAAITLRSRCIGTPYVLP
jgi:hypothetical protein